MRKWHYRLSWHNSRFIARVKSTCFGLDRAEYWFAMERITTVAPWPSDFSNELKGRRNNPIRRFAWPARASREKTSPWKTPVIACYRISFQRLVLLPVSCRLSHIAPKPSPPSKALPWWRRRNAEIFKAKLSSLVLRSGSCLRTSFSLTAYVSIQSVLFEISFSFGESGNSEFQTLGSHIHDEHWSKSTIVKTTVFVCYESSDEQSCWTWRKYFAILTCPIHVPCYSQRQGSKQFTHCAHT